MSQEIQNPFSISPNNGQINGFHHASENPFQALEKATEVKSPFAGVGERASLASGESENGRPARLPERRPDEQRASNPFEVMDQTKPASPFASATYHEPAKEVTPVALPAAPASQDPRLSQAEYERAAGFAALNHAPPRYEAAPQQYAPQSQQAAASQYDPFAAAQAPQYHQPQAVQQAPSYQPQAAPVVATSSLKQLELRAIFGVNHELTKEEIIQRARTLPGIRNVILTGEGEAQSWTTIKESVSRLGLGQSDALSLHTPSGYIDFIQDGATTLAVLHEGGYGPGVRETLIIVTRELGKLQ